MLPQSMGAIFMAVTLDRKSRTHSPNPKAGRRVLPGPVGFIGAGKVGTALASLLNARGIQRDAVSGRKPADGRRMALAAGLHREIACNRANTLAHADIVFLTVPDDVIGPLCDEIARAGGWREGQSVVHCSGALPSSI